MAILVVASVDAGSYRSKRAPIAADKALDGKGVSLSPSLCSLLATQSTASQIANTLLPDNESRNYRYSMIMTDRQCARLLLCPF